MQCRRRWSAVAVVVMAVATAGSALAATPIDPAVEAANLKKASGADALAIRMRVLDYANTLGPVAKDKFGRDMVGTSSSPGPFYKLLDDDNTEASLNAAIVIAQVQVISTDWALETMLESPKPSVRYWGAKGLSGIMPTLKVVGGAAFGNAVKALNTALSKETSGVVKQQLMKTLGDAGDARGLITALEGLEAQLRGAVPDHETLDAAATGLGLLETLISKGNTLAKADVERAAKAAAWIASFAAQQQVTLSNRMQAQNADMPPGFSGSVLAVVNNASKVLNGLAGKVVAPPVAASASPEEVQLAVDGVAGSASTGPGALQKAMASVPVPPAIAKNSPPTAVK